MLSISYFATGLATLLKSERRHYDLTNEPEGALKYWDGDPMAGTAKENFVHFSAVHNGSDFLEYIKRGANEPPKYMGPPGPRWPNQLQHSLSAICQTAAIELLASIVIYRIK